MRVHQQPLSRDEARLGSRDDKHRTLADRMRVPMINYGQFIKKGNSTVNWMVSLTLASIISITTFINFVYCLHKGRTVPFTYTDVYADRQEWLFGQDHTGPINPSLIYNFIESDNTSAMTKLVETLHAKPAGTVSDANACFGQVHRYGGSYYVLCDHLDRTRLPEWAVDFEALTLQTVRLSTVSDFERKFTRASTMTAIVQAYPNKRHGWFQQETTERLHCTTPQLASSVPGFVERVIYTKTRGVLRSVDCSNNAAGKQASGACEAIKGEDTNPTVMMFDDGTEVKPFIHAYEVFRDSSGEEVILTPFTTMDEIGSSVGSKIMWPIDSCLYLRDGSTGWFGIGIKQNQVTMPVSALIAKIEVISLVVVVWIVKYHCRPYCIHDALFQATRLGVFVFLVLQLTYSVYYEQDIMRAIYSWERRDTTDWTLMLYLLSSIAMTITLSAMVLVRVVLESSVANLGCWLSIALPLPVVLVELAVADGLQPQHLPDCKYPYTSCTPFMFNQLLWVHLMAVIPTVAEMYRACRRRRRRSTGPSVSMFQLTVAPGESVTTQKSGNLTTFEIHCLDHLHASELVWDATSMTTEINQVSHTTPVVITATGFTVIENRFVFRTENALLVVCAAILPRPMLRDASMVVWPLRVNSNGSVGVAPAQRVFLGRIHHIHIHGKPDASLLRGAEQPLC